MLRIAATSDPAPGSVSPKQASFSPFACGVSQRCFCSSVPYLSSDSEFSPTCTEINVRNAASPRSISSHASASDDVVEAGSTVFLRNHDAEDPELCHPLDQLEVELVVDVVLDRDR